MRAVKLSFLIVAGTLAVAAVKPVQGTGFTCKGPNGAVKRLNIDLKAKRYQEAGSAAEKIQEIDDASVTLKHYSTIRDGYYLLHRLDRSTLILSEVFGEEGRGASTDYQCEIGAPFNFAAERKF